MSGAAVGALMDRFSAFSIVPYWFSDKESHFKNKMKASINPALHFHQHYTEPSTPKSTATDELICREGVQCYRAIL